jgi:muramoyltetrapeptide carboxypeptidase
LEALGFRVVVSSDVYKSSGYVAGSSQERARAFMDLISNDDVSAIVCTIGGFNTVDILPHVDYELVRRARKVLVGYSDATALLLAVLRNSGLLTFHGPAAMPDWGESPPFSYTVRYFSELTQNVNAGTAYQPPSEWTADFVDWAIPPAQRRVRQMTPCNGWSTLNEGHAIGRLIGGNVETINALVGTPFCPDFSDSILFIEATEAEAYLPRIDRALAHLSLAGHLSSIKGLLVARCPDAQSVFGTSLDEVIRKHTEQLDIPVGVDLDFGHTEPKITLPIGLNAELSCSHSGVALQTCEPAVALRTAED